MQINSVKDNGKIFIINDSLFVPKDPGNRNYKEIKKWIENGGEIVKENERDRLEKRKNEKIEKLKNIRSDILEQNYSIQKQLHITNRIGFSDSDFNNMKIFITDILTKYRTVRDSINACENVEDLKKIDVKIEINSQIPIVNND